MDTLTRVLAVGASLAGLRSAQALCELGFTGEITLIGAEPHLPYDRPPLSKQVLTAGRAPTLPLAGVDTVGASWALGDPATGFDLDTGTVRARSGRSHTADAVVIATGAAPRPWSGPGAGLPGVITAHRRGRGPAPRRAGPACPHPRPGGGFVGAEVAAAARTRGCPTVMVEREALPLVTSLGPEAARTVTEALRRAGVDVRTATTVAAFVPAAGGTLAGAELDDGTTVPADLAVVGIGVHADTGWLHGSGLRLDDGVVCDHTCRSLSECGGRTSLPVVVAGDVARWPDPLRDGRLTAVRHWSNATEQARAAAATLLTPPGVDLPSHHLPTYWSDLTAPGLRIRIRAVGHTTDADTVTVVDGSLDTGSALLAYGRHGRIVGALALNRPRHLPALRDRILAGAPLTDHLERAPTT